MNKAVYFLLCFVWAFLLACGSKSNPQAEVSYFEYLDSINHKKAKSYQLEQEHMDSAKNAESTTSVSGSSSYSLGSSKTKYDNMRGFDPASEDDMDDNGMSRYMENNDEEGWD
jgi:hypothetical protein